VVLCSLHVLPTRTDHAGLHRNVAKAVEEVGGHFQLELMIDGFPLDIVMSGQRIAIEVSSLGMSMRRGWALH
jgi:hypothetical protein